MPRRLSPAARYWLAAAVPALVALGLHLPSIRFAFVRDDVQLISENALMRAPGGLSRLLTQDFAVSAGFTAGMWRPLVLLSFWLEGHLGGWGPAIFHASNVAIHAGVTFVLGLLLWQAGVPAMAVGAGALWFAVMPAHLEAVDWISGRTDLLCAGPVLLGLWLDRRARAAGRSWPGAGALVAFAAALLSKEAASFWTVVILAAEIARARANPASRADVRGIALWLAPYVAITLAWLGAHALLTGPVGLPAWVDAGLLARRRAAAWAMLPQELYFLWPWYPHASDVMFWLPARAFAWPVVAGAAFTLCVAAALGRLAWRGTPWTVPVAIVVAGVLPSITLALARGFMTTGERLFYLPSAGVAWLAAMGLARVMRKSAPWRNAAIAVAAIVILGSGIETLRLQPTWQDDAHVFSRMMEYQPNNPAGWLGTADLLAEEGRRGDALAALARAEAVAPGLPDVPSRRAWVHYQFGEWELAIAEASRSLAIDDAAFETRVLRASCLLRLRRHADAAEDIERLLHDRPGDPSALMLEGQRLLAEGRAGEALDPLAGAARGHPDDPSAWFTLGSAQATAGELPEARASLQRALTLVPHSVVGWRMLARVCASLGDSTEAAQATARAAAESGRGLGGSDSLGGGAR